MPEICVKLCLAVVFEPSAKRYHVTLYCWNALAITYARFVIFIKACGHTSFHQYWYNTHYYQIATGQAVDVDINSYIDTPAFDVLQ